MKIEIDTQKLFSNKRHVYAAVIVFSLSVFIFTVFYSYFTSPHPERIIVLDISDADSVITITENRIKPVLYRKMPALQELDTDVRKQKFIEVLLPTAFLARQIVAEKRKKLMELKDKESLTHSDSAFIDSLQNRFKAKGLDDLILRLHPQPVSITIAQAATESAWGTSRFCREADNLFGVWSFSKSDKRIAAGKTRDSKVIYLKKYDSLLESVLDYLYTIAGSNAFETFRQKRAISDNPYRLIWFLQNYSEKRMEYVITLRNMLEHNDLSRYDDFYFPKIYEKDTTWQKIVEKY